MYIKTSCSSRECQAKDWPIHKTSCSNTTENLTDHSQEISKIKLNTKFTTDDGSIYQDPELTGKFNLMLRQIILIPIR